MERSSHRRGMAVWAVWQGQGSALPLPYCPYCHTPPVRRTLYLILSWKKDKGQLFFVCIRAIIRSNTINLKEVVYHGFEIWRFPSARLDNGPDRYQRSCSGIRSDDQCGTDRRRIRL